MRGNLDRQKSKKKFSQLSPQRRVSCLGIFSASTFIRLAVDAALVNGNVGWADRYSQKIEY